MTPRRGATAATSSASSAAGVPRPLLLASEAYGPLNYDAAVATALVHPSRAKRVTRPLPFIDTRRAASAARVVRSRSPCTRPRLL